MEGRIVGCIIKVAAVGYTAVVPGDGKRRRQVSAFTCFLRTGGGVVNGHGASADPLLECGAVFADVMQQSGGARFVSRAERCGKTRGEFARAAKVFRNGLYSAVISNMGKILQDFNLQVCYISTI